MDPARPRPTDDAAALGAARALVVRLRTWAAADLAREGRYAEARATLAPSLADDRPDAGALDLWARIAAQEGRYAEACGAWRLALAIDPGVPGAREGLALAEREAAAAPAERPAPPTDAAAPGTVVVWTTRAGEVVGTRGPAAAVLGAPEEALVGTAFHAYLPGAHARADARSAAEAWAGARVGPRPTKWSRPDGGVVRVEVTVEAVATARGTVLALRRTVVGRRRPPFS